MKIPARLRSLADSIFHRSRTEDDMDEELRSHIQHRADDLERSGLDTVRQPHTALVEHDHACKGAEPLDEAPVRGLFPEDVPVGQEALDEDDVDGPVADDLVGDVYVAAPRVADRRHGVRHPGSITLLRRRVKKARRATLNTR